MTILTDAMIEAGARAMLDRVMNPDKNTNPADIERWMATTFRPEARACLIASLPEILEECAKVAESEDPNDYGDFPEAAAARIRNLKPKEEGNG